MYVQIRIENTDDHLPRNSTVSLYGVFVDYRIVDS